MLQALWHFGPVTSVLLPVEGLDGPHGAMTIMVQKGRHELLSLPTVVQLQNLKWDAFGRTLLRRRLFKHCCLLLVLQVGLCLPRASVTAPDLTARALVRRLCELITLFYTFRKLRVEVREMRSSGVTRYFAVGGASFFENCCSLVNCAAVMTAAAGRLVFGPADTTLENLAMGVASFSHWVYLAWFMLGYRLTGPFIIIVFQMLLYDLPSFLLVVSVFLGAFASSMHALSGTESFTSFVLDFYACLAPFLQVHCGVDLVVGSVPPGVPQACAGFSHAVCFWRRLQSRAFHVHIVSSFAAPPQRHGCVDLKDACFAITACVFSWCWPTTSLSEQQQGSFPSFSVLLPLFSHMGDGGHGTCLAWCCLPRSPCHT